VIDRLGTGDAMALLNPLDRNSHLVTGLAIGAAAVVLGPVLLPAIARVAKPLAKTAIKAGLVAMERGRDTLTELGEVAEDVMAEARAELAEEAAAAQAAREAAGTAAAAAAAAAADENSAHG
jgi:hypothetical protein